MRREDSLRSKLIDVAYKCLLFVVLSAVCAARASAQGEYTPHYATSADSIPLTIAAAEEMGARWSKPSGPVAALESDAGTPNRTCTEVTANGMLSGQFVSMGWSSYANNWRAGYGKIMWRPTAAGHPTSDTLTVRAVRLDVTSPPMIWRFPPVPANEAPWFRFPSGVVVPSTGKWMLIATTGENWGCFLYTLR